MARRTNRRNFLKHGAAASLGFFAAGGVSIGAQKEKAAVERLNIACIGVGGKGSSDTDQAAKVGNVVALCDIDDNTLNNKKNHKDKISGEQPFLKCQTFHDFREMLDKMDKDIDAVVVSTADHTHAPASVMAMKKKKHVYCQKPLTHSVYEARRMREIAAEMGVCTQMGNQGTAEGGLRRAAELIQAGVLGNVSEVHVWTNRPIWPQGSDAILRVGAAKAAAMAALHGKPLASTTSATPPKHIHWDLFLGPAPERPYDPIYTPFSWRGWWDFGTGALGDMACHTANMAYMALKLGAPSSITAEVGDVNPESYPMWARITFQVPARGDMQALKFVWYEGSDRGKRVLPPREYLHGKEYSDSGSLIVGSKGILFSPNDYGAAFEFIGPSGKDITEEARKVPEKLPRNGRGDLGMKQEWVEAIKANKPELAVSNFSYAGPLTEFILLGNVAIRAGNKKKLDWDAAACKVTNWAEAEKYIKTEYRKGWTL